jgi:hypothetical protein
MAKYCKAYHVSAFREFPQWSERTDALRPAIVQTGDGGSREVRRTTLEPEDVLYLHTNLTVTDGIFVDQNLVFASDTPEWKAFCHGTLQFRVPDYVRSESAPTAQRTVESV